VLPNEPQAGQFWLGRFGADVADDVVLAVKTAAQPTNPDGPTREQGQGSMGLEDSTHPTESSPWVEIHCHGGREIVQLLLDLLQSRGVMICTWQELAQRTEKESLRTQAVIALAHATTTRTAAILLDQVHGTFRRTVAEVLALLRNGDCSGAALRLAALTSRAPVGRHLTTPWRVTIAGAPNVGKSSLINGLAGYQRSIVAPTPGTTRDVVTTRTAFDGWPVELADTAGVRDDTEPTEAAGIDLALDAARAADLCLWVVDASTSPVWPDPRLGNLQLVVNKIDLPAAWDLAAAKGAAVVSALTGAGIPELCDTIARRLVPAPPVPGDAVPFTPRLCDQLEEVSALCRAGLAIDAARLLESMNGSKGSATQVG
jgi:tRNA modification GTPase